MSRVERCFGLLALLAAVPSWALSFEEIQATATRHTHEESCLLMQDWVDHHAEDPRAPRGLVWMGQLRLADRQPERAKPIFEHVRDRYPDTEWALHARKALADLDLEHHRYGRAIAAYEDLARSPVPFFQYVGSMAALAARGERARFFGVLGLTSVLLALLLGRLVPLGFRALWPPPQEVSWTLPLPLVMVLAAFGQERAEGTAVILIGLGSVALLWLNGAYLRARPPRGAGRLLQLGFGLLQAGALFYTAVVVSGLWEKFKDTLTLGAE